MTLPGRRTEGGTSASGRGPKEHKQGREVVIIDVEIAKACEPENVTRVAGCHPTIGALDHPVPDGARAWQETKSAVG